MDRFYKQGPGKLPSRCFLKHIIPLEPGTLEGKASFSSRLKTRGTYDARVTEFQTPGRLSARTRLPPRFSRLSSFVSVLPSSSLRDNKVTSRVYGEIEVFPHSPPRYCRLQLFNRATSMILPPLRRVAKGQQWFESCMRFRATSSRVWMDFFPSFLRLIMARIRRVRKQLYASKVSVYACCWFLLLICRSIVCCTG